MPEIAITLAQWAAWAPGLDSTAAWADQQARPTPDAAGPDLSWLPPMQRRRLTILARAVFHVAREAGGEHLARLPIVLASSHGELSRTQNLLSSLADGAPVSPTAFTLSVHNAVSGQLSIALGNRAPASCVALAGDGISGALLEAQCLAGPDQEVLLVLYDAPLPPQYQPFQLDDQAPWALALRLGATGTTYRLSRGPGSGHQPDQGLALARYLAAGASRLTLRGARSDWLWRRHD